MFISKKKSGKYILKDYIDVKDYYKYIYIKLVNIM